MENVAPYQHAAILLEPLGVWRARGSTDCAAQVYNDVPELVTVA